MSLVPPSVGDKRKAFHALHASGCFVIPNPWDAGSTRYLQGLGFKALASTSSGMAWALGQPDNRVRREHVLAHLRQIVAATDLPVNADFESGFGVDATGVAESVSLAVETGVAGLSIEDATGDPARPLFALDEAVSRMRAARRAIDRNGGDTLLVGRAEAFLCGRPNLQETIARLQAYAQAGADCLYAPGLTTHEQIVSVVKAVAPKPVNLLVGSATSGLTVLVGDNYLDRRVASRRNVTRRLVVVSGFLFSKSSMAEGCGHVGEGGGGGQRNRASGALSTDVAGAPSGASSTCP